MSQENFNQIYDYVTSKIDDNIEGGNNNNDGNNDDDVAMTTNEDNKILMQVQQNINNSYNSLAPLFAHLALDAYTYADCKSTDEAQAIARRQEKEYQEKYHIKRCDLLTSPDYPIFDELLTSCVFGIKFTVSQDQEDASAQNCSASQYDTIVLAIRGTQISNTDDLKLDAKILISGTMGLRSTDRFRTLTRRLNTIKRCRKWNTNVPVVIVGHSLGGSLAKELLEMYTYKIASIHIFNPGASVGDAFENLRDKYLAYWKKDLKCRLYLRQLRRKTFVYHTKFDLISLFSRVFDANSFELIDLHSEKITTLQRTDSILTPEQQLLLQELAEENIQQNDGSDRKSDTDSSTISNDNCVSPSSAIESINSEEKQIDFSQNKTDNSNTLNIDTTSDRNNRGGIMYYLQNEIEHVVSKAEAVHSIETLTNVMNNNNTTNSSCSNI